MSTEQKSIAEAAYEYAATASGYPFVEWGNLEGCAKDFYVAISLFALRDGGLRQPPLQTKEHWMLLPPKAIHMAKDEFWRDSRTWGTIGDMAVGDTVGLTYPCRRLVRVPVEGGWVKAKDREPMENDADSSGKVECLHVGTPNVREFKDWDEVPTHPYTWWRTPTPPPVVSEPVDECLEAFRLVSPESFYHESGHLIESCTSNLEEFRKGWTAHEKSLKEAAK